MNDDWLQSLLEHANEKHKDSTIVEVSCFFFLSLSLKSSPFFFSNFKFGIVMTAATVAV